MSVRFAFMCQVHKTETIPTNLNPQWKPFELGWLDVLVFVCMRACLGSCVACLFEYMLNCGFEFALNYQLHVYVLELELVRLYT